MAWEWVSPTATAAVGIAAVGFASRTSRKGEDARARESEGLRKHERDLMVRSERRETFALFLASLDAFDRVIYQSSLNMKAWFGEGHSQDEPGPPATFTMMLDRIAEIRKHYYDVLLVGTDAVRYAAGIVFRDALDAWGGAVQGDQDSRTLLPGPRDALTTAMREDLGYAD